MNEDNEITSIDFIVWLAEEQEKIGKRFKYIENFVRVNQHILTPEQILKWQSVSTKFMNAFHELSYAELLLVEDPAFAGTSNTKKEL